MPKDWQDGRVGAEDEEEEAQSQEGNTKEDLPAEPGEVLLILEDIDWTTIMSQI